MNSNNWWQRPDLCYVNDELVFDSRYLKDLAEQLPTPAFLYSSKRIKHNIMALKNALNDQGFKRDHQVYFAMKANRFMPLLTYLKSTELCGIDACSPAEVELAMSCGFAANEISFTAGSLSQNDFRRLAKINQLIFNCDSLQSIRTWGQLKPGSEIGIRINPAMGTGRSNNEKLHYAGSITTKFGIYKEQFDAALNLAASYNLTVSRIHFHTGCGYLNNELDSWQNVLSESLWFINRCPELAFINVGGGLGVPHIESDQTLDVALWAQKLFEVYGQLDVSIAIEPGEYIVKDAGVLLLEKTLLETKKDKLFAGVNAGFNIAPEPVYYNMPFEPVALTDSSDKQPVTIIGNINEAMDVWYEDIMMPDLSEHNHIAIINCGAYSSSMASNHCMRGEFMEYLLF